MLKAIIAPLVLQRDYVVDMERCYIAGFSNGGAVATLVTTARPEQFKGGLYISGSVFWGDQAPPKLEQIRQNRHVFMAGTYDKMLKDMKRVHANYKKAGVESAKLITTRDFREWQGPPSGRGRLCFKSVLRRPRVGHRVPGRSKLVGRWRCAVCLTKHVLGSLLDEGIVQVFVTALCGHFVIALLGVLEEHGFPQP